MSKYSSKYWGAILEARTIDYGHQKRNAKQLFRKVLNTLLAAIAYRCPSNKLRIQLHRWRGCHIGDNCYIGQYCFIDNLTPEYIYIADNASVNARCMLVAHFNPSEKYKNIFTAEARPIVINEYAMVAIGCIVLPGVNIGKYAVVNAGTTLDRNVPDYHLYTSNSKPKCINLQKLIVNKE